MAAKRCENRNLDLYSQKQAEKVADLFLNISQKNVHNLL